MNVSLSACRTQFFLGLITASLSKWKGNLTLLWAPSEAWLVSVRGNVNGDFYDVSVPTGEVSLDGYTDIDLSIQRDLTEKVSLKLLVDNLVRPRELNLDSYLALKEFNKTGRLSEFWFVTQ